MEFHMAALGSVANIFHLLRSLGSEIKRLKGCCQLQVPTAKEHAFVSPPDDFMQL